MLLLAHALVRSEKRASYMAACGPFGSCNVVANGAHQNQ
jgi:hypothetical protein